MAPDLLPGVQDRRPTLRSDCRFSAVKTIGLTPEGPWFGPPGYEMNLLYIAGLIFGGAGPLWIDAWRSRSHERHLA